MEEFLRLIGRGDRPGSAVNYSRVPSRSRQRSVSDHHGAGLPESGRAAQVSGRLAGPIRWRTIRPASGRVPHSGGSQDQRFRCSCNRGWQSGEMGTSADTEEIGWRRTPRRPFRQWSPWEKLCAAFRRSVLYNRIRRNSQRLVSGRRADCHPQSAAWAAIRSRSPRWKARLRGEAKGYSHCGVQDLYRAAQETGGI